MENTLKRQTTSYGYKDCEVVLCGLKAPNHDEEHLDGGSVKGPYPSHFRVK